MKILFYSPVRLSAGGGCERWHCDVTHSLKSQFGYDIQIVTANLGESRWTDAYLKKQLHVPYTMLRFPKVFGALIPSPRAFFKLLKYFQWADTIHIIQGFIGQDIFILLLKLITGKKVVVGHHAPIFHKVWLHNAYMKYVTSHLLNYFDAHMTLNAKDKKFLEDKWNIKNVYFIPSGIRIERFLKLPRIKHKTLNFITVGIYRPQKGIDLLLPAIEMFNLKLPNNKAVFRFVGSGEQKELINTYSARHKNIKDLGYVEYEKIPNLYEQSDVYLLPSREEPFGLVLIEAWSSGIPALATKTEGPTDMLIDGKNGWFIESIRTESMFESILQVYNNWLISNTYLTSMEESSRKTGREFSIDVTAKRMREYLLV